MGLLIVIKERSLMMVVKLMSWMLPVTGFWLLLNRVEVL